MSRIYRLHQHTTHQIAAGEVIERPASIVKELMENSLDAGAQAIHLDIEYGGHKLIQVKDNGHGIHQADLVLALERYATSKIKEASDLQHIASLGFRGEALASIASVARVELVSRHQETAMAYRVEAETSHVSDPSPAAHPIGTTITIRDLFHNIPVRKKFLRNPATEFRHITMMVERIVLSRFALNVVLSHNGKEMRRFPASYTETTHLDRIEAILLSGFRKAAVPIEYQQASMVLSGYLGDPRYTRGQADSQYIYINGRFVRDKLIARAIHQAYQDVLFHSRYPAYVIYLDIDPELVDVNVHPSKYEVRFRDSRLVFDVVKHGVQQVLENIKPGATVSLTQEGSNAVTSDKKGLSQPHSIALSPNKVPHAIPSVLDHASPLSSPRQAPKHLSVREQSAVGYTTHPASQTELKANLGERGRDPAEIDADVASERLSRTEATTTATVGTKDDQPIDALQPNKEARQASSPITELAPSPPLGYALAQLHRIYILAQNQQGLIMVDMHAAHERILYEKMKREMKASGLMLQPLLMPIVMDLNTQEQGVWATYGRQMVSLGLGLKQVDAKTMSLDALPAVLPAHQAEPCIRDILSDLANHAGLACVQEKIHAILAAVACRSALRAHHHLTIEEMNYLLRQMESTQHGGLCNHGRPAWKQFSMRELDAWFLRGQ